MVSIIYEVDPAKMKTADEKKKKKMLFDIFLKISTAIFRLKIVILF